MFRSLLAVPALLVLTGTALAQSAPDPQAMAAGQEIFERQCALCHKADGSGRGEVFPALAGNANLADASTFVTLAHFGGGVMPPFPQLDDTQLAAVATYIRNSWGNSFGGVSPEEVTAIRADLGPAEATRTIWDGVYTEDQAERGNEVYRSSCGTCHGTRLNGVPDDQDMSPAPPLARANFLRNWDQRSLGSVFAYSHSTMPLSNPGFLTQEQYADIVALMLSTTGAPAGDEELPPDHVALGHIIITPQP